MTSTPFSELLPCLPFLKNNQLKIIKEAYFGGALGQLLSRQRCSCVHTQHLAWFPHHSISTVTDLLLCLLSLPPSFHYLCPSLPLALCLCLCLFSLCSLNLENSSSTLSAYKYDHPSRLSTNGAITSIAASHFNPVSHISVACVVYTLQMVPDVTLLISFLKVGPLLCLLEI